MEDHHVDRPGVEAQQCVKLTGTNSSIGLIVLMQSMHETKRLVRGERFVGLRIITLQALENSRNLCRLCRPGGFGGEPPPDPIPNSVVKVPSADGTTS